MEERTYVGIGKNPDGRDLPVGLGMRLMEEPAAMDGFSQLSEEQKAGLFEFIQGGSTGDEAKERIATAISFLRDNPPQAF